MVKCRCVKQEKMIDFDYCQEYLKTIYQTKYYYGCVKKSTFSFSSDLQIDKKIQYKKRSEVKKIIETDFSQVPRYLVLMRF